MSKYINAKEIERVIRNDVPLKLLMTNSLNCASKNGIEIAEIISEKAKPADVVKVKHGYWCDKYKSGVVVKQGVVSSCCDMWNEHRTKYCPYCGAILDEERKENNERKP